MANEYLDKEGLKRLVSLLKYEMSELEAKINAVDEAVKNVDHSEYVKDTDYVAKNEEQDNRLAELEAKIDAVDEAVKNKELTTMEYVDGKYAELAVENQALILGLRVSREDMTDNEFTIDLSHLYGSSSDGLIDWGTYAGGIITKGVYTYTYDFSKISGQEITVRIKATGISSIEGAAFYDNQLLTYVKVPSSVKELGANCFKQCKSLTEVDLPEGLTTIEQSAFHLCMSLKNLVIPSTVTGIGLNAFYRCEALEWVKFESHTPVDVWATRFDRCNNLTKVFVPNDALESYKTAWSATNFRLKLDAVAHVSNIPPVPPTMNFAYNTLAANTQYPIKRNGYYMVYSGSANLTLAKADGTVVVEGAKQIQFMTPPVEGGSNIKACGMYWTGSSLGGVEGFRRSTNDGGYVTAPTEFYVAEMVNE